jgi:two-component system sensor histidine kinase BaeS
MERDIGLVMHSFFGSLRVRIFIGSLLVLFLGLLIVNLFATRMVEVQVSEFQTRSSEAQIQRIQNYFSEQNNLSKRTPNEIANEISSLANIVGRRVVFQDKQGRILFDSNTERKLRSLMLDKSLSREQIPEARIRYLKELNNKSPLNDQFRKSPINNMSNISNIAVGPSADAFRPPPSESRLLSGINRSLVVAGIIGSIFGLIISSLTSNWVLSPIRQLRSSVSRFGSGQLTERVEIKGSGEIGELAESFNLMAEQMDLAHQQRRKLIADISHELRTPISNMQGYIEAIEDEILEPNDKNMKIMHDQILQLSNVVEDLRVLAEVDSGDLKLKKEMRSLGSTIDGVVNAFGLRASEKNVSLLANFEKSNELVLIDEERIKQVITNLLNNALRYSPGGSRVDIDLEENDGMFRISVSDKGPGIPPSDVELIFNRFYRVDSSRNKESGGRGLGLSIAKEFVEAHGGNIWVETISGGGSKFIFEIPKLID